jgi:hypothetical protein
MKVEDLPDDLRAAVINASLERPRRPITMPFRMPATAPVISRPAD